MDDYAKARFKSNHTFTLIRMSNRDGGMNPAMSSVDFIQDDDLNKSLKLYVSNSIVVFFFPVSFRFNMSNS